MKKTIFSFSLILLTFLSVNAQQDSTKSGTVSKSTTFTTYVDAYYRADFAGLKDNNKTSFTNSTGSPQLGMASFKVDQTYGKFAATLDLGYGKRADEFSYNDKGLATVVKQGYVSFAPNSTFKFTR